MDIPLLMISAAQEGGSFIENSIKYMKVRQKDLDEKELLNVWMELNCDKKSISFTPFAYQQEQSERTFYYLGNNSAAAAQIYAVREAKDLLNYWTGRMNGILMNILEFLPECTLKEKMEICRQKGLFDETGLNIQYMPELAAKTEICQEIINGKKEKGLRLNEEKVSGEKWLSCTMGLSARQKPMLIVPVIILNGKRIVISRESDYIHAIENFLGNASPEKGSKGKKMAVCHLCGRLTDTIDTKTFSSKLDRYSISKVFVTTPIHYASEFKQKLHQKNFAICKSCYEKWFSAEKTIMKEYQLRIAGENAVILVDGITQRMNREDLSRISKKIDAAFHPEKYKNWITELTEDYFEEQDIALFEFNLIFFKSDGKSCAVKKSIEDVSNIWFHHVMKTFRSMRTAEDFAGVLRYFDLGSIYHMIPVRMNNKGEQLNINRVLEVYAAMLQRNIIESKVLFEYFAEALEVGHREITARELRNFKNLHRMEWYHEQVLKGKISGLEWYIMYMCYSYQALIEILQKLGILQNEVFKMGNFSEEKEQDVKDRRDIVQEKEDFLNRHGFSEYAKGIYYVGAMMYQIGVMQYHQKHENKPILEKVTYSGMSRKDIICLLSELHDKVRQYRSAMNSKGKGYLVYYAEQFAERAYAYLGNFPAETKLAQDEHENLFYLMSGYSGCMQKEDRKTDEEE